MPAPLKEVTALKKKKLLAGTEVEIL